MLYGGSDYSYRSIEILGLCPVCGLLLCNFNAGNEPLY